MSNSLFLLLLTVCFCVPDVALAADAISDAGSIEEMKNATSSSWEVNIFYAIIGAFLSAIFSPTMAVFFLRWHKSEEEAFNIKNGLIFLGAANGFWVLTFLLGDSNFITEKENISQALPIALYSIATIFFLMAMEQFFRSKTHEISKTAIVTLFFIAAGNLLWLFYDAYEALITYKSIPFVEYYAPGFYYYIETNQQKITSFILHLSGLSFLIVIIALILKGFYKLAIQLLSKIKFDVLEARQKELDFKKHMSRFEELPKDEQIKILAQAFNEKDSLSASGNGSA